MSSRFTLAMLAIFTLSSCQWDFSGLGYIAEEEEYRKDGQTCAVISVVNALRENRVNKPEKKGSRLYIYRMLLQYVVKDTVNEEFKIFDLGRDTDTEGQLDPQPVTQRDRDRYTSAVDKEWRFDPFISYNGAHQYQVDFNTLRIDYPYDDATFDIRLKDLILDDRQRIFSNNRDLEQYEIRDFSITKNFDCFKAHVVTLYNRAHVPGGRVAAGNPENIQVDVTSFDLLSGWERQSFITDPATRNFETVSSLIKERHNIINQALLDLANRGGNGLQYMEDQAKGALSSFINIVTGQERSSNNSLELVKNQLPELEVRLGNTEVSKGVYQALGQILDKTETFTSEL